MKVLLVWPVSDTVESDRSKQTLMESRDKLGILYVAACLEQHNIDVSILDMDIDNISWGEAKRIIKESKADIIGISLMTYTRFTGFKVARLAKKLSPQSFVVVGGAHASPTARDLLAHIKAIDIVVIGEGEITMHELCLALQRGKDISSVDGVAYRKDGAYFEAKPRRAIENLDILPFPARHLLKRYSGEGYPKSRMFWVDENGNGQTSEVASIVTSRGCPYGCSFCTTRALFGRKVRQRSPENIVMELEHVVKNYGIKSFYIVDDTLTLNQPLVIKLCELIIEKKLDIQWMCLTRVDCLSPEMLNKMKKAGCVYITMGIESGNQRVLDEVIKKKITLEQGRKALLWCKEAGIGIRFNFILSFPDETYQEMVDTLNASIEFEHGAMNITVIMPGTEMEREALKRGVLPKDFTWTKRKVYPKVDPFFTGVIYYYIKEVDFAEVFSIFLEYTKRQKYYSTDSFIKRHIKKISQIRSFDEIYWLFAFYLGTFLVMLRMKFFKPGRLNGTK